MKLLSQEDNRKIVEARKIVERALFELYKQEKDLEDISDNPSEKATSLYREVFGEGEYLYRYAEKSSLGYCVEVCKLDKLGGEPEVLDIVFLTFRFSEIERMLKSNNQLHNYEDVRKLVRKLLEKGSVYPVIYAISYYTANGGHFFGGEFRPARPIEILDNLFEAEKIYFESCEKFPLVREVSEYGYRIYEFNPYKPLEEVDSHDFFVRCIPKQVNRFWLWKSFKEQYPEFEEIDTTDDSVNFGKFIPAIKGFEGKKIMFLSEGMKKQLRYYGDKDTLYSLFVFKHGTWTREPCKPL